MRLDLVKHDRTGKKIDLHVLIEGENEESVMQLLKPIFFVLSGQGIDIEQTRSDNRNTKEISLTQ